MKLQLILRYNLEVSVAFQLDHNKRPPREKNHAHVHKGTGGGHDNYYNFSTGSPLYGNYIYNNLPLPVLYWTDTGLLPGGKNMQIMNNAA